MKRKILKSFVILGVSTFILVPSALAATSIKPGQVYKQVKDFNAEYTSHLDKTTSASKTSLNNTLTNLNKRETDEKNNYNIELNRINKVQVAEKKRLEDAKSKAKTDLDRVHIGDQIKISDQQFELQKKDLEMKSKLKIQELELQKANIKDQTTLVNQSTEAQKSLLSRVITIIKPLLNM